MLNLHKNTHLFSYYTPSVAWGGGSDSSMAPSTQLHFGPIAPPCRASTWLSRWDLLQTPTTGISGSGAGSAACTCWSSSWSGAGTLCGSTTSCNGAYGEVSGKQPSGTFGVWTIDFLFWWCLSVLFFLLLALSENGIVFYFSFQVFVSKIQKTSHFLSVNLVYCDFAELTYLFWKFIMQNFLHGWYIICKKRGLFQLV